MTTLEADRKALMTEVSADTSLTALQAAVKADDAAIKTALGTDARPRPSVGDDPRLGRQARDRRRPVQGGGHPMGAGKHGLPGGFGPGGFGPAPTP